MNYGVFPQAIERQRKISFLNQCFDPKGKFTNRSNTLHYSAALRETAIFSALPQSNATPMRCTCDDWLNHNNYVVARQFRS